MYQPYKYRYLNKDKETETEKLNDLPTVIDKSIYICKIRMQVCFCFCCKY